MERIKVISLIFLSSTCFSQIPTIEEFNRQEAKVQQEEQNSFDIFWFGILKNKSEIPHKQFRPSRLRRSTENFLYNTGGLKAKFAEASRSNTYGFTLTRPDDENSRKAGFHRSRKSIFMDIGQMTSNEWLMIFVHEVSHSLDSELINSLDIYNNEVLVKYFSELGAKNTALTELSKNDRELLNTWLMAGLNRGFLAEYRAWLLTYLIYDEGLKDGTFAPIDWLENLKNSKPAGLDVRVYILRSLSPDWTDPVDGIFAHQFIKDALRQLRQRIFNNPLEVKMDDIEKLIQKRSAHDE